MFIFLSQFILNVSTKATQGDQIPGVIEFNKKQI